MSPEIQKAPSHRALGNWRNRGSLATTVFGYSATISIASLQRGHVVWYTPLSESPSRLLQRGHDGTEPAGTTTLSLAMERVKAVTVSPVPLD